MIIYLAKSIHTLLFFKPLVMPESADVAVTTMLALLIIADISGNCLVCLVIKKNKDMR